MSKMLNVSPRNNLLTYPVPLWYNRWVRLIERIVMVKPKSTQHYTYTNPHPKGIKTLGDCVFRAISIATGKDWLTVYDELTTLGREVLAPPNDKATYNVYLDRIADRVEVKYKTAGGTKRHTPRTLPKNGTYVMSQANHLATIKNGKVRDLFDSSSRSAYVIWKVR
jgi:hypothetical protein